ncbi:MAG: hypothetical protein ACOYMV_05440 [Verrucomicrobiia bacterium]
MRTIELKIARIGNSRGVRLPAATLRRYHIGEHVLMEERAEDILLHPKVPGVPKLSWKETALEMAAGLEDWSGWEAVDGDGLENLPWKRNSHAVAESKAVYRAKAVRHRQVRAGKAT